MEDKIKTEYFSDFCWPEEAANVLRLRNIRFTKIIAVKHSEDSREWCVYYE